MCIKKIDAFFGKHYKEITFITGLIYITALVSCIFFIQKNWKESADNYSDNFLIEFTAGIIFTLIPIIYGIYLGKRLKSHLFHVKIKSVLKDIADNTPHNIKSPTARKMVKSIVENLGDGIIEEPWFKDYKNVTTEKTTNCEVCKLAIDVAKGKCKICKLNCYAWELD